MPHSPDFARRMSDALPRLMAHQPTPFHLYDEAGIRATARRLQAAFAPTPYRQYFAVKALPNPRILRMLFEEGQGFDCSSIPELLLAVAAGAGPGDIFFTSNNTTAGELRAAAACGAILNLDDETHVRLLPEGVRHVSFRLNPGESERDCATLGALRHAKFGVPTTRLADAYRAARDHGCERFGLHAMLSSNELSAETALANVRRLLGVAVELEAQAALSLDFINLGGGLGVPYRLEDEAFELEKFAHGVARLLEQHFPDPERRPALMTECGRFVTAPHGVLVTRVINVATKWKTFVGVDASMSALMRPGLYAHAYHHITAPLRPEAPALCCDVVGSLCENMDKFAIDRLLPPVEPGDVLLIHDTGAHGHAMGFTYNGRLRPAEILLTEAGAFEAIRRAETPADYFATLPGEERAKLEAAATRLAADALEPAE